MSVVARRLTVSRYRNFDSFTLDLSSGTTILVGKNAVGKTNLVEAMQLLTSGQSFRKSSPRDLVKEGCERAELEVNLEGDGREISTALVVEGGRRTYRRAGKRIAPAQLSRILPSVVFCPDHLDMVKRSASVRREAIDALGAQLSEKYDRLASSYERAVSQRNALLKDWDTPRALLRSWDEAVATQAAALIAHRVALFQRLEGHFSEVYSFISGGGCAEISYVSSMGDIPSAKGEIAGRLMDIYERSYEEERARGATLTGPHRDDILFSVDGRAARLFGSQGQQRMLTLAWKMAEVQVIHDIMGTYPVLLLDDVMSELDGERREAVMDFIERQVQTLITTTNLGYFSDDALVRSHVVEIGRG